MGLKKQFIPYEQALKLKELGFNEECLNYYSTPNHPSLQPAILLGSNPSDPLMESEMNKIGVWKIKAPLWQQAWEFFREEKNVNWEHTFDDSQISLYVGKIAYPDNNLEFFKIIEVDYDKYSIAFNEAQLDCLNKLIEICLNKK